MHAAGGGGENFNFLYIILLNSKVCKCKIAIKLFELRNDVDTIGLDNVCSCAFAFNLVSTLLDGATTEC